MGYDGGSRSSDQAPIAAGSVVRYRYPCHLEKVEPRRHYLHMKTDILQPQFGKAHWMVWMDVDSIMVNPIDEVFSDDYDVALVVKKPGLASKRHGNYVYAGFSVWNSTPAAKWFLDEYAKHRYPSDQRELHHILEQNLSLDDSIFERVGEIIETDRFRLKLLDPDKYIHLDAIQKMEMWTDDVSVLHFKGVLGRKWREYVDRYCRV